MHSVTERYNRIRNAMGVQGCFSEEEEGVVSYDSGEMFDDVAALHRRYVHFMRITPEYGSAFAQLAAKGYEGEGLAKVERIPGRVGQGKLCTLHLDIFARALRDLGGYRCRESVVHNCSFGTCVGLRVAILERIHTWAEEIRETKGRDDLFTVPTLTLVKHFHLQTFSEKGEGERVAEIVAATAELCRSVFPTSKHFKRERLREIWQMVEAWYRHDRSPQRRRPCLPQNPPATERRSTRAVIMKDDKKGEVVEGNESEVNNVVSILAVDLDSDLIVGELKGGKKIQFPIKSLNVRTASALAQYIDKVTAIAGNDMLVWRWKSKTEECVSCLLSCRQIAYRQRGGGGCRMLATLFSPLLCLMLLQLLILTPPRLSATLLPHSTLPSTRPRTSISIIKQRGAVSRMWIQDSGLAVEGAIARGVIEVEPRQVIQSRMVDLWYFLLVLLATFCCKFAGLRDGTLRTGVSTIRCLSRRLLSLVSIMIVRVRGVWCNILGQVGRGTGVVNCLWRVGRHGMERVVVGMIVCWMRMLMAMAAVCLGSLESDRELRIDVFTLYGEVRGELLPAVATGRNLVVEGLMDGLPVRIVIDTGAGASMVGRSFLSRITQRRKVNYIQGPRVEIVGVASNTPLKIEGIYRADIDLGGKVVRTDLVASLDMECDAILSLDTLKRLGAVINLSKERAAILFTKLGVALEEVQSVGEVGLINDAVLLSRGVKIEANQVEVLDLTKPGVQMEDPEVEEEMAWVVGTAFIEDNKNNDIEIPKVVSIREQVASEAVVELHIKQAGVASGSVMDSIPGRCGVGAETGTSSLNYRTADLGESSRRYEASRLGMERTPQPVGIPGWGPPEIQSAGGEAYQHGSSVSRCDQATHAESKYESSYPPSKALLSRMGDEARGGVPWDEGNGGPPRKATEEVASPWDEGNGGPPRKATEEVASPWDESNGGPPRKATEVASLPWVRAWARPAKEGYRARLSCTGAKPTEWRSRIK